MNSRWLENTVVTSPASTSASSASPPAWPLPSMARMPVERLHDLAEQFPGHLASPVAGVQDLDGLPVQPAAKLGHLIPRP